MKILICNVGSTSLKYQLLDMESETVLASGGAERVGKENGSFYARTPASGEELREQACFPSHAEAIARMLRQLHETVLPDLGALACVSFKVVHARGISGVQLLTEEVLQKMEAFNCVAPAHNPPYLSAIRQFRALLPGTPLIGAFETAFHADMPDEAKLYSIPLELSRRYQIRRYGFHGASLQYLTEWTQCAMEREDIRLVACHLGGSSSVCAVKNGKSIDTSMGLGLQCGLPQNNRCGDLDPYAVFYLMEEGGMSEAEVRALLETKSGLLGLSGGVGNDLRDLEAAAEAGNDDALLAIRCYCYAIKKYIGAYAAAMGGLDAIAFGGGIGRGSALVRAMSLSGLEFLGVRLDGFQNRTALGGMDISLPDSPVRIFVIDTNEELIVARKAAALLRGEAG